MADPVDQIHDVTPFDSFVDAAQSSVEFLRERIGLDLWIVTQVRDNWQSAVVAYPDTLVRPGMALPWAEGFCSRMVAGVGPRVATVTAAVPAYAGLSPTGPDHRISAYLGVPLVRADGALFGTLCGFGLRAQPPTLARHLPLVEHVARLLSTILAQEGAVAQREEVIDRAVAESERDALTGLLNRRGWERSIEVEEARARRSGGDITVLVLDVDDLKSVNDSQGHLAGDDYLRAVASVLGANCRPTDIVSRTGGDEFAVLLARAPEVDTEVETVDATFVERLRGQLAGAGVAASIGLARRRDGGVVGAIARADAAMYEVKDERRALRPGATVGGRRA